MKPLKSRKNPVIAGILAFMFGAIGVGLYLRSWRDAGVTLALGLGLSILSVQLGLVGSAIVGVVLATYAVTRVMKSNELLEQAQTPDQRITLVPA
jgi:mannose/fructose/N-acetylgalactosamine-specific phosphotransferase system component IIC